GKVVVMVEKSKASDSGGKLQLAKHDSGSSSSSSSSKSSKPSKATSSTSSTSSKSSTASTKSSNSSVNGRGSYTGPSVPGPPPKHYRVYKETSTTFKNPMLVPSTVQMS